MKIREIAETHAIACRKAILEGRERPVYCGPFLEGAYLTGVDLAGARLRGAYLRSTNLRGAKLQGADLRVANLEGADLQDADLEGADLMGANLRITNLQSTILPDGRTLEQWQADPLAGLCTEPEAVRRATAAWGAKSWENCPMHAAHGWNNYKDAPAEKKVLLVTFIALYDRDHLPKPGGV